MTKEEAKIIIEFLMRADLKGHEALAFMRACKTLEQFMTDPPKDKAEN